MTITETIVLTLAVEQTQTHTMNLGKTLVITMARTMNQIESC